MKLSRSHALFLVGTLAAAACTVENADDDDNNKGGAGSGAKGGSAGTSGSGTGGTGVAGQGTGGAAAGKGGAGGTVETGGSGNATNAGEAGYSAGEGGAGGYSAGEGGMGGYSAGEGGTSSTAEGGAGGEGGVASVCDDTQADQLGCEDLNTSSCGNQTFLDAKCAMTWKNMKPSISNVARNCMLELSQDDLCNDSLKTYACIDQALHDACPDDTVTSDCDTILGFGSCSGKSEVTAETCSTYLSGLTANGRSEMVSCMEGYCDFYSCGEGLN